MTSQFSETMSTSYFFWRCFVWLVRFSYWSKFQVNVITGSGIMAIFFYERLTRNTEVGNNPVWILPNIWRLDWVMNTKLDTKVYNRMLLNAAKFQDYNFYCFWVIKGKPTGWEITLLEMLHFLVLIIVNHLILVIEKITTLFKVKTDDSTGKTNNKGQR